MIAHELTNSVKGVAKNLATNLMGYYRSQPETTVKGFPPILGVWVSGLVWSTLIDYQHYTGDDTFSGEVTAALTNEELLGANNDFLYDRNVSFRATDDVANLGLAALTAAERNFPAKLRRRLFDDKVCDGGIPWQIDSGNSPVYVSTLGTGAVFQLAARLARLTGDEDGSYANFASQLWDWTVEVGFITEDFEVVDGASAITNCQSINRVQLTQSSGLYLLGAAALANVTGDQQWTDRTKGLAARIAENFFVGGGDNGGVMVEIACEAAQTCPSDMQAMKGGLATALWRATQMAPFLDGLLRPLLEASAKAAAASCTFGRSKEDCPIIWDADITGINNSLTGPGQQVSVLAIVQGLLMSSADAPTRETTPLAVARARPIKETLRAMMIPAPSACV
ncbi:unnamed protein product [Parascedosporium putredinis]|uniref:mannan endo-1,6-alpha-mannosidase n=1 Tax=Parascedosporium putredinis TaxID=1442378 RepID=A0A9P1MAZ0_9PEZI|nr:unnamed protein product [Parascedosporium putredinis]CAI7994997.1 unnamed protein product [Parascedosporium putredinis]